jgi:hypothetical protein
MLLRNPHLLVASAFGFAPVERLEGTTEGEIGGVGRFVEDEGLRGFGTSKMCRLPLSDVHASMLPAGLNRRENIVAFSLPRLLSANLAQLAVANIRTIVP